MDERIQMAGQKCDEYRVSGYRCSESLIRGCADAMGIVLSDEMLRATGVFSGGHKMNGDVRYGQQRNKQS